MTDESQDRPVLSPVDLMLLRSEASPTHAQVEDTRKAIGARIAALAAGAAVTQAASSAQATGAASTAAGTTAAVAATKSVAAISAAKWISAGLIVTAVAGGTVVATRRSESAPHTTQGTVSAAPAVATVQAPALQPAQAIAVPAPEQPKAIELPALEAVPAVEKAATPRSSARRAAGEAKPMRATETGTLAGELALLRNARQALGSGDAEGALEQLDAHAARYPNAVLKQEALAARALALCAAGRQTEARRAAAQLTRIAPRSPHLIRLADSCAAGDPDATE